LPFWLRAAEGAGARGAILVEDLRSAYHWMRFWETSGQKVCWIAQEYLPGRDIAWTGIYFHGQLVTSFARERLEYIYPHLTPSGLTGTPTISRVIHDEDVNFYAERAVLTIDGEPHGVMSVDLREDKWGMPRPTEINAGRGFTTLGLWSLYGPNFVELAVACAVAQGAQVRLPSGWPREDSLPEGLTLYRHLDCGHRFVLEPAPVAA
jgi:carbamoyl-phosphate synthase large subunit